MYKCRERERKREICIYIYIYCIYTLIHITYKDFGCSMCENLLFFHHIFPRLPHPLLLLEDLHFPTSRGFLESGYPNSWMVNFMENPICTWMRTGATPSLGNLHLRSLRSPKVVEKATRDMLSIHLGLLRGDAQVHSTGRGLAVSLQKTAESVGSVSKPCTPGEHQNSW